MLLTPTAENLPRATEALDAFLDGTDCPPKARIALETVLEEVFMNIVLYSGATVAQMDMELAGSEVKLRFTDDGIAYNPLNRSEPDVTLPLAERSIGGLGILMIRRMTDSQAYEYTNGRNILTLRKSIA